MFPDQLRISLVPRIQLGHPRKPALSLAGNAPSQGTKQKWIGNPGGRTIFPIDEGTPPGNGTLDLRITANECVRPNDAVGNLYAGFHKRSILKHGIGTNDSPVSHQHFFAYPARSAQLRLLGNVRVQIDPYARL